MKNNNHNKNKKDLVLCINLDHLPIQNRKGFMINLRNNVKINGVNNYLVLSSLIL